MRRLAHMRAVMLDAARALLGAAKSMRDRLATLVTIEIVVSVATLAVVAPLASWAVRLLVLASGQVAVSNIELVSFALSAHGAVALVLFAVILLVSRFVHEALVVSAVAGRTKTPWGAFVGVVRSAPALVKLAFVQLAGLALLAAPLVGLAMLAAAWLLGEHDINYLLTARPPAFRGLLAVVAVLAVAGIGLLLIASVLLSYSVSLTLFERERPLRAIVRSARAAWRHRGPTFAAHFILILAVVATSTGLGGALWVIQTAVLGAAGQNLSAVIAGVALVLVLEGVTGVLVSSLAFVMRGSLIASLYQGEFGTPEPDEVPTRSPIARRTVIVALVAITLGGTTLTAHRIMREGPQPDRTLITAHRGSSLQAPENTMAAIHAAIAEGADIIEIDVQESSDGVIVVLHDRDLMRIAGDPRRVWEMTIEQLQAVDIGTHFAPRFAGERIPTLKDALEAVRGRARLLIELKYNGHDVDLAGRVVQLIREAGLEEQCLIMSLESRGVADVRRLAPEIQVGLTLSVSVGDTTRTDADFLAISGSSLTVDRAELYRRSGLGIHVWTVNAEADMHRFFDMGVDSIITDDPALAARVREERAELSYVERILLAFGHRMR